MWFAVLRIVIPLLVVVLLLGFFIPRIVQKRRKDSRRIDVEAEVVKTEQPKTSDIPQSKTYSSATTDDK